VQVLIVVSGQHLDGVGQRRAPDRPVLSVDAVADVEAGVGELANAIFEYLEIFHNRQRRHSLGLAHPG
jgi:hypothetical protein